jgi:hypothetical protein
MLATEAFSPNPAKMKARGLRIDTGVSQDEGRATAPHSILSRRASKLDHPLAHPFDAGEARTVLRCKSLGGKCCRRRGGVSRGPEALRLDKSVRDRAANGGSSCSLAHREWSAAPAEHTPLSSSPHAHNFVLGNAVINTTGSHAAVSRRQGRGVRGASGSMPHTASLLQPCSPRLQRPLLHP